MEIIEINGNEKCVSGLLFDRESNSYFFVFANGKWNITFNNEYHQCYPYFTFLSKRDGSFTFDLIEKNGKLFRMIKLNDKDSYSDMRRLWEIINEDS